MYEQLRTNEQHDDSQAVLRFRSGDTPDPRRYNEPSARDIAAVFTGDRPPSRREISVYSRTSAGAGDTHDVSYLNEHVDPMTYPLLFPAGDKGWCPELQIAGTEHEPPNPKNKLGACDFYAQKLMVQDHTSRMPHAGGRLFQQYVVDAYCKIEAQRLDWVDKNQDKLRTETLQGLLGYVHSLDDESPVSDSMQTRAADVPAAADVTSQAADEPRAAAPVRQTRQSTASSSSRMLPERLTPPTLTYTVPFPKMVGKPVYLPSSFVGGPRHLHQCFLDAMAMVAKYGRPDAFITMTASPRWADVVANLRPGEQAHNRPDLIARVFRQKLRALLHDLTVEHRMGRAIAFTYVIEFQKRGSPARTHPFDIRQRQQTQVSKRCRSIGLS